MGCSHPSGNVPPQAGLRLGHRAATDRRQDRLGHGPGLPVQAYQRAREKKKGKERIAGICQERQVTPDRGWGR